MQKGVENLEKTMKEQKEKSKKQVALSCPC